MMRTGQEWYAAGRRPSGLALARIVANKSFWLVDSLRPNALLGQFAFLGAIIGGTAATLLAGGWRTYVLRNVIEQNADQRKF